MYATLPEPDTLTSALAEAAPNAAARAESAIVSFFIIIIPFLIKYEFLIKN